MTIISLMMDNKGFRYEQVISKIEETIVSLNLKPGDKVPSVRNVSEELQVSLSTVFQAYAVLEAKGVLISRPRSGYYISTHALKPTRLSEKNAPIPLPVQVEINTMATTMMKNAKEHGIINFSILAPVNEFLPIAKLNKAVQASLKESGNDNFQYPLVEGHPRLLKQIARNSFEWKKTVSPDKILITNGCMEAINLCLDAVTQRGDIVAIESPTYHGILQSLESRGLRALEIPTDPATGLNLKKLAAALNKNKVAACVFTPSCNNPIGCDMPEENKIRLVKLLGEQDIPLIEDDSLGELTFTKKRPRSAKSFDEYDNVLYCSSFSKSLSPGFRIGWVTAGKYHPRVEKLKFGANISTTGLLQDALGRFLESGQYDRHLKGMRIALQKQVLKYLAAITDYFPQEVRVSVPAGGYSVWIELPDTVDALDMQRKALQKGIGICPGHIFSANPIYHNYIRINCCPLWNLKVENAIKTLGQVINELK